MRIVIVIRIVCNNIVPDYAGASGTIALELLEQVLQLDVIVVPIGGGGMCSGQF